MACSRLSCNHIYSFWRNIDGMGRWFWTRPKVGNKMLYSQLPMHLRYGSITLSRKGYAKLPIFPKLEPLTAARARHLQSNPYVSSEDLRTTQHILADSSKLSKRNASVDPLNNRVMLVDGTAIMFRSYYKLLAKLQHGLLEHADGNGDWVLTIFTALSLLFDVLEFIPSHVAVIFDHDGVPFGHTTTMPSKESYMAKGLTFRHMLYPSYKSNRIPTPDTVVQGLQYLKASIKAMSIKVIEVPGVEADDVVGTLAVNSVSAGYKVRIVSPDKDFFQILSPSLRLLRIAPRGSGDVQASSILLDDKFEVRLGSLSEVCTQEGEGHQNVITRMLRLSQTSEQGISVSSTATCAYDVYCVGKVLLELVTGKLGISGSNDAATNEWIEHTLRHVNLYEKELVTKIVDPSLIVDEDHLEEVWAVAIVAKSCLNPKPSKRPLMRYVLKALENPLKVVREENDSGSARLRTTSSRGSWNAAFFGSWRRNSSDIGGPAREDQSLKRSATLRSQGSGGEHSSSNKRSSKEIFPEPSGVRDTED